MLALRLAAWAAFGFAALCGVLFVNDGFVLLLSAAIGFVVSGILFLAADRVIVLLTAIRDALVPEQVVAEVENDAAPLAEPRSIEEIKRDLDRLKGKL